MQTVFLILVFSSAFTACQVLWELFHVVGERRAVNHRLRVAGQVTALGERVLKLRKHRGHGALNALAWAWLKILISRSGVVVDLRRAGAELPLDSAA